MEGIGRSSKQPNSPEIKCEVLRKKQIPLYESNGHHATAYTFHDSHDTLSCLNTLYWSWNARGSPEFQTSIPPQSRWTTLGKAAILAIGRCSTYQVPKMILAAFLGDLAPCVKSSSFLGDTVCCWLRRENNGVTVSRAHLQSGIYHGLLLWNQSTAGYEAVMRLLWYCKSWGFSFTHQCRVGKGFCRCVTHFCCGCRGYSPALTRSFSRYCPSEDQGYL